MPNRLTWCDLPADVSLWPGLPLSLSGDEVMPLDYRAGRTGWLLYGRGLDKQRLTDYQHQLGAAMVIVSAWNVDEYQVIRLAGSLTPFASKLAHDAADTLAYMMTSAYDLRLTQERHPLVHFHPLREHAGLSLSQQ